MLPKVEAVRKTRSGQVQKRGKVNPTHVNVIEYSATTYSEVALTDMSLCNEAKRSNFFKWVDVQGAADADLVKQIGEIFELHPLAMEDVVHRHQRPKFEPYDHHIFFVAHLAKMIKPGDVDDTEVAIFIGPDYVITFMDRYGELLDPVRQRLRKNGARIRTSGVDYLAYAIIDAIVDCYFPVLEDLGDYFQKIEERVVDEPSPELFREMHQLRRELLRLRRSVWPQRDAINALIREENQIVTEPVRVYLRDCYDHSVQIIDVIETYRELISGLVDLYLSSLSNRLNGVMKVLTMISTIFMPLSFLAGVYGMNFKHMPELDHRWGYPAVLTVMFVIFCGMIWFFRKEGWLGKPPPRKKKLKVPT